MTQNEEYRLAKDLSSLLLLFLEIEVSPVRSKIYINEENTFQEQEMQVRFTVFKQIKGNDNVDV